MLNMDGGGMCMVPLEEMGGGGRSVLGAGVVAAAVDGGGCDMVGG